jgi:hypothetical protein
MPGSASVYKYVFVRRQQDEPANQVPARVGLLNCKIHYHPSSDVRLEISPKSNTHTSVHKYQGTWKTFICFLVGYSDMLALGSKCDNGQTLNRSIHGVFQGC